MSQPLLEVAGVTKHFGAGWRRPGVPALVDLSLTVGDDPATITAIAGESGSGKTTLADVILGFTTPTSGTVRFRGMDVHRLTRPQLRQFRRDVQAIFQDPVAAFNPFYRVRHVFQVVARHLLPATGQEPVDALVERVLAEVGLAAEDVLDRYPHQLSGGQRQRLMIARALMTRPRLIVADEPVSMVDASLRSSILALLRRLCDERGISFLYITHDLSTAYQISDYLHVLYRGHLVEHGAATQVIDEPKHPYVRTLVESVPVPDPRRRWDGALPTRLSDPDSAPAVGRCVYLERCPQRMDVCGSSEPALVPVGSGRRTACFQYGDGRSPHATTHHGDSHPGDSQPATHPGDPHPSTHVRSKA